MIKRLFFFSLVYIFVSGSVVLSASLKMKPAYTLNYHGQSVYLKTGMIQKHGVLFFPLRDLAGSLKGVLSKNRKLGSYVLNVNDIAFEASFFVNQTRVLVNGSPYYLNQAPFLYSGRLYVPVTGFFALMGDQVSVEKKRVLVQKGVFDAQRFVGSAGDLTTNDVRTSFQLPLPTFTDKDSFSLILDQRVYPLQAHFFYYHRILFVALADILRDEGFDVKKTATDLSISFKGTTAKFSMSRATVFIDIKGKRKSFESPYPMQKREGVFYIPFVSFLEAFDYGVTWFGRKKQILLLSKLYKASWDATMGKEVFRVYSRYPVVLEELKSLPMGRGYFVDVPLSDRSISERLVTMNHGLLSQVQFKSLDSGGTRVILRLGEQGVLPQVVKTSYGFAFTFKTSLLSISESVNRGVLNLSIRGSQSFRAKHWVENNPPRLVLDVPHSVNHLPQIYKSKYAFFKSIRSSQFSVSPMVSRLVIDFDGQVPSFELEPKGDQLHILFHSGSKGPSFERKVNKLFTAPVQGFKRLFSSKTPITAASGSVSQVASGVEVSERKYRSRSRFDVRDKGQSSLLLKKKASPGRSVLAGKVIFLDAGHGGVDPGALGLYREYEKYYNLDVTLKLKALLEKKGAYVVLSRDRDRTVSLQNRVKMANRNKADMFLSIHFNSHHKKSVHGTETFYYKSKDKKLASFLQKQLIKDIKLKDNGVKRGRLYVLRHSKMPAVLVEPAFMTNKVNLKKLKKKRTRMKIAESLYQGIHDYFQHL